MGARRHARTVTLPAKDKKTKQKNYIAVTFFARLLPPTSPRLATTTTASSPLRFPITFPPPGRSVGGADAAIRAIAVAAAAAAAASAASEHANGPGRGEAKSSTGPRAKQGVPGVTGTACEGGGGRAGRERDRDAYDDDAFAEEEGTEAWSFSREEEALPHPTGVDA